MGREAVRGMRVQLSGRLGRKVEMAEIKVRVIREGC